MMVGYDELQKMGVPHTPYNIRRKVRNGTFPKPSTGGRSPSAGAFQWEKKDVVAWLKVEKTRRAALKARRW